MNTLNKTTTSRFFATEGGYQELRARWSKIMQDKDARKALTSTHHALYAVLLGRDWRKGFTAPKNPIEGMPTPQSVIDGLDRAATHLNAKPTIGYAKLGNIVPGTSGYRPYIDFSTVNPFFGLLAEGVEVESFIPLFASGQFLPETAYTMAFQKQEVTA